MKHKYFLLMLLCLVSCFHSRPKITTGLEGKPLPSFNLLLMDSTTQLNTSNIPNGKPLVMFYFNPFCPYCRAQTQEMIDHMKSFNNTRVYLFSNFPFSLVKSYYDHYHLKNYPTITVGVDYGGYFGNYYKVTGVPYLAVYNKDKQLKEVLVGKTRINTIKNIIQE